MLGEKEEFPSNREEFEKYLAWQCFQLWAVANFTNLNTKNPIVHQGIEFIVNDSPTFRLETKFYEAMGRQAKFVPPETLVDSETGFFFLLLAAYVFFFVPYLHAF